MAKRRLNEMYLVGQEETFDDGQGDPVTVFIKKLNPVEHESALRNANAARARFLARRSDPESEDRMAIMDAVFDFDKDGLITYLVSEERVTRIQLREAETAADEEWEKDAYLQGLYDAWNGGLNDAYAENNEDPEAARVFAEIQRFNGQVEALVKGDTDDLRAELDERPLDVLRERVLDKLVSTQASIAWLNEYRRSEVAYSVRELDKKTRYFKGRDEVDDLPAEVYNRLADVYRRLSLDPIEGKAQRETGDSSPSSELPDEPGTEPSFGPVDAVL